jgi:hypothetical protein
MMHPHFFHWHDRAELKPEPAILEPRWNAAASFASDISVGDLCSLLQLFLFSRITQDFAKRFSDELIKKEPTFPPRNNTELLRAMAAACLHSVLSESSYQADAIALGIRSAAFPEQRAQPVCNEVMQLAGEYLAKESEEMRPAIHLGGEFSSLKTALDATEWASNPNATTIVGNAVIEMGSVLDRLAEECQFLWWIVGRRSPILDKARHKLTAKEYAFVVAAEAESRVSSLPPPSSSESLIDEALSHCSDDSDTTLPLTKLIEGANAPQIPLDGFQKSFADLTPLASLLSLLREGNKADAAALRQLGIDPKLKLSAVEAGRQFFRELMFLRSLKQVG